MIKHAQDCKNFVDEEPEDEEYGVVFNVRENYNVVCHGLVGDNSYASGVGSATTGLSHSWMFAYLASIYSAS